MHRALALLCCLAGLTCTETRTVTEEVVTFKDYPVEFDGPDDPSEVEGDPELTLGVYRDQRFTELSDGDEVSLVYGLQGGTWVHVSLRATGVAADGELEGRLGELGDVHYRLKLTRSPEGLLEAYDVPVPVEPANGGSLGDLFGKTYDLEVGFTAGGVSLSAKRSVVLVDG